MGDLSFSNIPSQEATKDLDTYIGGSGGLSKKGLVPACSPSDGLGLKFFSDDGTWKTVAGSGTFTKTTVNFGDNASLVFVIPHGIVGGDVVPYVKKVSTGEIANCTISNDATNVTITFAGTPPTVNEFRLVVIG